MDMLLNWKKGPGFKRIENITIPEYEELSLDNGTKLITVNQGKNFHLNGTVLQTAARLGIPFINCCRWQ